MPLLLVIDDDDAILHALRRIFQHTEITVLTAESGAEGLELFQTRPPDAILLDLALPDQSGIEVFHQLQAFEHKAPVIIMTGEGTAESAIEAIRHGAFDYLNKPVDVDTLRTLVARAIKLAPQLQMPSRITGESACVASEVLVGNCTAISDVYKLIGRVAAQDVTVLIQGESGTGKELVSRAIYRHSKRSSGPFLAINCAAIPETLLESELFGHEKGAFTGAERRRIGKFEQASGGTLFLDEIGDMSPLTQAKVLRVLQEQRFERVGGDVTIQTDVRLIAATNRDLGRLALAGRFRSDLYYRLNVFTIELPPLRERFDDLPLLVDHFLRRFSRDLGRNVTHASPQVIDLLRLYPWPGNLRELQSVLKQSLLQASGTVLLPQFLPAFISRGTAAPAGQQHGAALLQSSFVDERLREGSHNLYAEALAVMERDLLSRVLDATKGNQFQAAKILGITRGSLRTKIRSLGITIARSVQSEGDPPEC